MEIALLALSLGCVLGVSLLCFGGAASLLQSTYHCAHKVTALALLQGHLAYPRPLLAGIEYDMEVFNGASYSTWGYGVPLLQLPFHFFRRLFSGGGDAVFFPDRLIFFLYLSAAATLLWLSLRALLRSRYQVFEPLRAQLAASCLTLFFLTFSLYWLISLRFVVYEETIAYFILTQLAVLACFLFQSLKPRALWAALAGGIAGLAVLVRGTALVHLLVWGGCFYGVRRSRSDLKRFSAFALPGLLFWSISNYEKSGEIFSLGLQNSLPGLAFQFLSARFHSACSSSWTGLYELTAQFLWGFFLGPRALPPRLAECHFMVEERGTQHTPFIGPAFSGAVIAILIYQLVRNRRRLEIFLPYLAMVTLFFAYVEGGVAIIYRYAGDFWPLILLVFAQFLLHCRAPRKEWLVPLCLLLAFPCVTKIHNEVLPQLSTLRVTDEPARLCAASLGTTRDELNAVRLPSRVSCRDKVIELSQNKLGWNESTCHTEEITNLFLGVPPKASSRYQLLFDLDKPRAEEYRVYINGRYYHAKRNGKSYAADFSLPASRLRSPNIVVTIQWRPDYGTVDSRLLEVKIL